MKKIDCPVCRSTVNVPVRGLSGDDWANILPDNFLMFVLRNRACHVKECEKNPKPNLLVLTVWMLCMMFVTVVTKSAKCQKTRDFTY